MRENFPFIELFALRKKASFPARITSPGRTIPLPAGYAGTLI